MNRKIVFLLFPQTHLLDLAGPAQVFYEASRLGGSNYRILYCAASRMVHFEQSLTVSKLIDFSGLSLQPGDFVCIPGIDFQSFKLGKMDGPISEVRSWVRDQYMRGVFIGSICSGALILAKMDMLDGIECTTHWKCLEYLRKQFKRTRVNENRIYCFNKGIFTSAGMAAGIDMALALVEQWDSPLVAARVAQEMVINVRRVDSVEQRNIFLDFKNHFNADVYKAQEILSADLNSDFTIDKLASQLNMSGRHLSRLFKDHTGQTIQAYRDRVRLEYGEQLLMHSEKSVKEIAIACGFENSRQFIRLWKRYKGNTPGRFRQQ
jgi:transcriptional regulator GlxA family with amidase domain